MHAADLTGVRSVRTTLSLVLRYVDGLTVRYEAVVAVDDIKVIFRMPNGKTVEYPLVKLSEESQEELAQLKE